MSLHYPQHASALTLALWEDPFYVELARSFGEIEDPKSAMDRYMDFSMREAARYGVLFMMDQPGRGAAVWSKPLSAARQAEKTKRKHRFLEEDLGTPTLEFYKAISDFMDAEASRCVPEGAWYLSILGVDPAVQGLGLGKALLSQTLEALREQSTAAYLEAFGEETLRFYEKLGFRTVARPLEPTVQAPYWVMVMEPDGLEKNDE